MSETQGATDTRRSTSSVSTSQRNLQTIPRHADGSPRYARGWHMVGWSDEFTADKPEGRDYFGMRLVLFRGQDGKMRCLDAFCAHLGADLSAGKIVGETIQCAYHNWRYNGDGQCVSIPYCEKIPPRAKTRALQVKEINDTVLVWYDPEWGEPDYDIPAMDEYCSKSATVPTGYSRGWHRFKLRIKTHAREVIENIADKGHLFPIHGFKCDKWFPIYNGPIGGEIMWGTHTRLAADVPNDILYTRNITWGPSYQYTWQVQDSHQFDSIIVTAWCPVDESTLDYWFGVAVKANEQQFSEAELDAFAHGYAVANEEAFMEDVYIWERKLFRPEPVLCAEDGPIAKLRRWYSQFYIDRAQANFSPYQNDNIKWKVEELRDRQNDVLAVNQ